MTFSRISALLAAGSAIVALAACNKAEAPTANGSAETADASSPTKPAADDPIASAERAAPASIAKNASVMTIDANGQMKTLREGSNGWTCMPDSPATPGPDSMCMDGNAMAWAAAWIGKKTPPSEVPGVMYMLEGGTDASNTDPYAKAPSEGNDWIQTGPHLMVVGSQAMLKGYPSGAKPDTKVPYVMWAGTPYAHLMIPVGD
jgi:hypothetical protein